MITRCAQIALNVKVMKQAPIQLSCGSERGSSAVSAVIHLRAASSLTPEVEECASFCANAWIRASLTTNHGPASVIPNEKRELVSTVIFTGPNVF